MEDENKIRLKNALRLVSASNEDLFFDSNSVYDDSSADNCVQVKDPFDDDTINDSDGENETPDPIQMHGKVIYVFKPIRKILNSFCCFTATK